MQPSAPSDTDSGHTLAELGVLANISPRTVRYYVQMGLVDRPDGETRAARYGARHLEQLLTIRKWTEAGLSLDAIGRLLKDEAPSDAPPAPASGSVSVRSHVQVADGVEVVIDPALSALDPAQLRAFVRGVVAAYARAVAPGKDD